VVVGVGGEPVGAHQSLVDAVIPARDGQNVVVTGVGSGRAKRVRDGVGTARGEPDGLRGRDSVTQRSGDVALERRRIGEKPPVVGPVGDHVRELRVGVTEQESAEAHPEVDVLVSVFVVDVGAISRVNPVGIRVWNRYRVVRTASDGDVFWHSSE